MLAFTCACRIGFSPLGDASDATTDAGLGTPMVVRSVGFGSTAPLATGAGNPLRLSGSVAAFQEPLPDRIGVGDAIVFDTNGDRVVDSIAFVYRRRSAHELELATDAGELVPTDELADDAWQIYRAHVSLDDAAALRPNPSIPVAFDTSASTRDLVARGASHHIACYADAPHIATARIEGWTTSAEFPLRIFVPTDEEQVGVSQRHAGAWDPAKFVVARPSQAMDRAIDVNDVMVEIEGLQVDVPTDGTSGDQPYGVSFRGTTVPSRSRVSSTLLRSNGLVGAASHPRGIFVSADPPAPLTIHAWNNAFFDFGDNTGGYGIEVKSGNRATLSNNTFVRGGRGLAGEDGATAVARNNLLVGCQLTCLGSGGGQITGENNLASDESASSRGLGATLPTASPTDYLRGALDPHIDTSATHHAALIGAGVDLSADPDLPFTIDIDGDARATPWDVGADEM